MRLHDRELFRPRGKEQNNSLTYVRNVINYIQLKYSEPIKIDTIAMSLGLNRSYLTRLFKEATGYSLQEYLLTYRMKMAARMLSDETTSVNMIASNVGYNDTFTFSKAFKRHFGSSPSEYRKTASSASSPSGTIMVEAQK